MALDGFLGIRAISTLTEGSVSASGGKWSMMEDFWPLSTFRRYSTYGLERGSMRNLMFSMRVKTCTSHHKTEREWAVETIAARKPLDTTCGHCRKSPPKTTILPPKGKFGRCMMSHKVWSTTSAQCRCCAGASSQTISFAFRSSSAESLYTSIEHIEFLPMSIGILKTKCEVHPPSNRRVAMPEEATPMVTCPSHRIDANNTLYTKVLPDPPKPSRKNTALSPWATALNIVVIAISWQMLSHGKFWLTYPWSTSLS